MSTLPKPSVTPILVATGAALLFGAYWAIFFLTTDDGIWGGARNAAYNVIPALALAFIMHALLDRFIWTAPLYVQISAQVPAAIAFALVWYLSILVLRSLQPGWTTGELVISTFSPIAFVWQMFQGVTFYALVALASLAITLGRRIIALDAELSEAERKATENAVSNSAGSPSTIIIKTDDETVSLAIDEIVAVSGAGDYSTLMLCDRSLLSTSRLGEFEARLPVERFVRAHRSHLVRLDAVVRTEPAGNGRTTLHLENGMSIVASRSGSRLFKEAVL